jgi:hypothetical protein
MGLAGKRLARKASDARLEAYVAVFLPLSVCSRHFDCDVAMAMICGQAKILIRRMKEPCLAVH